MGWRVLFNKELLIGLSTIFGWTPGILLFLSALFSVLTGVVALSQFHVLNGLLFISIGIGGSLGFAALTSVCWGLKIGVVKRFCFLLSGVVSLLTVIIIGFIGTFGWFSLYVNWVTIYVLFCPLIIGIIHLGVHAYLFKKSI